MLKNVCDRCGKVIDGDGNMPDVNAFDAYIDDDPVISYIHLCDKCRDKITEILIYNIDGKKRPQKPKAPKKIEAGTHENAPAQSPKPEEPKALPENEDLKNEPMGKVVKRVPLPQPKHHEHNTTLFDD